MSDDINRPESPEEAAGRRYTERQATGHAGNDLDRIEAAMRRARATFDRVTPNRDIVSPRARNIRVTQPGRPGQPVIVGQGGTPAPTQTTYNKRPPIIPNKPWSGNDPQVAVREADWRFQRALPILRPLTTPGVREQNTYANDARKTMAVHDAIRQIKADGFAQLNNVRQFARNSPDYVQGQAIIAQAEAALVELDNSSLRDSARQTLDLILQAGALTPGDDFKLKLLARQAVKTVLGNRILNDTQRWMHSQREMQTPLTAEQQTMARFARLVGHRHGTAMRLPALPSGQPTGARPSSQMTEIDKAIAKAVAGAQAAMAKGRAALASLSNPIGQPTATGTLTTTEIQEVAQASATLSGGQVGRLQFPIPFNLPETGGMSIVGLRDARGRLSQALHNPNQPNKAAITAKIQEIDHTLRRVEGHRPGTGAQTVAVNYSSIAAAASNDVDIASRKIARAQERLQDAQRLADVTNPYGYWEVAERSRTTTNTGEPITEAMRRLGLTASGTPRPGESQDGVRMAQKIIHARDAFERAAKQNLRAPKFSDRALPINANNPLNLIPTVAGRGVPIHDLFGAGRGYRSGTSVNYAHATYNPLRGTASKEVLLSMGLDPNDKQNLADMQQLLAHYQQVRGFQREYEEQKISGGPINKGPIGSDSHIDRAFGPGKDYRAGSMQQRQELLETLLAAEVKGLISPAQARDYRQKAIGMGILRRGDMLDPQTDRLMRADENIAQLMTGAGVYRGDPMPVNHARFDEANQAFYDETDELRGITNRAIFNALTYDEGKSAENAKRKPYNTNQLNHYARQLSYTADLADLLQAWKAGNWGLAEKIGAKVWSVSEQEAGSILSDGQVHQELARVANDLAHRQRVLGSGAGYTGQDLPFGRQAERSGWLTQAPGLSAHWEEQVKQTLWNPNFILSNDGTGFIAGRTLTSTERAGGSHSRFESSPPGANAGMLQRMLLDPGYAQQKLTDWKSYDDYESIERTWKGLASPNTDFGRRQRYANALSNRLTRHIRTDLRDVNATFNDVSRRSQALVSTEAQDTIQRMGKQPYSLVVPPLTSPFDITQSRGVEDLFLHQARQAQQIYGDLTGVFAHAAGPHYMTIKGQATQEWQGSAPAPFNPIVAFLRPYMEMSLEGSDAVMAPAGARAIKHSTQNKYLSSQLAANGMDRDDSLSASGLLKIVRDRTKSWDETTIAGLGEPHRILKQALAREMEEFTFIGAGQHNPVGDRFANFFDAGNPTESSGWIPYGTQSIFDLLTEQLGRPITVGDLWVPEEDSHAYLGDWKSAPWPNEDWTVQDRLTRSIPALVQDILRPEAPKDLYGYRDNPDAQAALDEIRGARGLGTVAELAEASGTNNWTSYKQKEYKRRRWGKMVSPYVGLQEFLHSATASPIARGFDSDPALGLLSMAALPGGMTPTEALALSAHDRGQFLHLPLGAKGTGTEQLHQFLTGQIDLDPKTGELIPLGAHAPPLGDARRQDLARRNQLVAGGVMNAMWETIASHSNTYHTVPIAGSQSGSLAHYDLTHEAWAEQNHQILLQLGEHRQALLTRVKAGDLTPQQAIADLGAAVKGHMLPMGFGTIAGRQQEGFDPGMGFRGIQTVEQAQQLQNVLFRGIQEYTTLGGGERTTFNISTLQDATTTMQWHKALDRESTMAMGYHERLSAMIADHPDRPQAILARQAQRPRGDGTLTLTMPTWKFGEPRSSHIQEQLGTDVLGGVGFHKLNQYPRPYSLKEYSNLGRLLDPNFAGGMAGQWTDPRLADRLGGDSLIRTARTLMGLKDPKGGKTAASGLLGKLFGRKSGGTAVKTPASQRLTLLERMERDRMGEPLTAALRLRLPDARNHAEFTPEQAKLLVQTLKQHGLHGNNAKADTWHAEWNQLYYGKQAERNRGIFANVPHPLQKDEHGNPIGRTSEQYRGNYDYLMRKFADDPQTKIPTELFYDGNDPLWSNRMVDSDLARSFEGWAYDGKAPGDHRLGMGAMPMGGRIYAGQNSLVLKNLRHYVEHPDALLDAPGQPMAFRGSTGEYRMSDGHHRVAAARIRGVNDLETHLAHPFGTTAASGYGDMSSILGLGRPKEYNYVPERRPGETATTTFRPGVGGRNRLDAGLPYHEWMEHRPLTGAIADVQAMYHADPDLVTFFKQVNDQNWDATRFRAEAPGDPNVGGYFTGSTLDVDQAFRFASGLRPGSTGVARAVRSTGGDPLSHPYLAMLHETAAAGYLHQIPGHILENVRRHNPEFHAELMGAGGRYMQLPPTTAENKTDVDHILPYVYQAIEGHAITQPPVAQVGVGFDWVHHSAERLPVPPHGRGGGAYSWYEGQQSALTKRVTEGMPSAVWLGPAGTGKNEVEAVSAMLPLFGYPWSSGRATSVEGMHAIVSMTHNAVNESLRRLKRLGMTDSEIDVARRMGLVTTAHGMGNRAIGEIGWEEIFGRTTGGGQDFSGATPTQAMANWGARGWVTNGPGGPEIPAGRAFTKFEQVNYPRQVEVFREALHELVKDPSLDLTSENSPLKKIVPWVNTGEVRRGKGRGVRQDDRNRVAFGIETGMTQQEQALYNTWSAMSEWGWRWEDLQDVFNPEGHYTPMGAGSQPGHPSFYLAGLIGGRMEEILSRGTVRQVRDSRTNASNWELAREFMPYEMIAQPLRWIRENRSTRPDLMNKLPLLNKKIHFTEAQDITLGMSELGREFAGGPHNTVYSGDPMQQLFAYQGTTDLLLSLMADQAQKANVLDIFDESGRHTEGKVNFLNQLYEGAKVVNPATQVPERLTWATPLRAARLKGDPRTDRAIRVEAFDLLDSQGNLVEAKGGGGTNWETEVVAELLSRLTGAGEQSFRSTNPGQMNRQMTKLGVGMGTHHIADTMTMRRSNRDIGQTAHVMNQVYGLDVVAKYSQERGNRWEELINFAEANGLTEQVLQQILTADGHLTENPDKVVQAFPRFFENIRSVDYELYSKFRGENGVGKLLNELADVFTFWRYTPHTQMIDPATGQYLDPKGRGLVTHIWGSKGSESRLGIIPDVSEYNYPITTAKSPSQAAESFFRWNTEMTRSEQTLHLFTEPGGGFREGHGQRFERRQQAVPSALWHAIRAHEQGLPVGDIFLGPENRQSIDARRAIEGLRDDALTPWTMRDVSTFDFMRTNTPIVGDTDPGAPIFKPAKRRMWRPWGKNNTHGGSSDETILVNEIPTLPPEVAITHDGRAFRLPQGPLALDGGSVAGIRTASQAAAEGLHMQNLPDIAQDPAAGLGGWTLIEGSRFRMTHDPAEAYGKQALDPAQTARAFGRGRVVSQLLGGRSAAVGTPFEYSPAGAGRGHRPGTNYEPTSTIYAQFGSADMMENARALALADSIGMHLQTPGDAFPGMASFVGGSEEHVGQFGLKLSKLWAEDKARGGTGFTPLDAGAEAHLQSRWTGPHSEFMPILGGGQEAAVRAMGLDPSLTGEIPLRMGTTKPGAHDWTPGAAKDYVKHLEESFGALGKAATEASSSFGKVKESATAVAKEFESQLTHGTLAPGVGQGKGFLFKSEDGKGGLAPHLIESMPYGDSLHRRPAADNPIEGHATYGKGGYVDWKRDAASGAAGYGPSTPPTPIHAGSRRTGGGTVGGGGGDYTAGGPEDSGWDPDRRGMFGNFMHTMWNVQWMSQQAQGGIGQLYQNAREQVGSAGDQARAFQYATYAGKMMPQAGSPDFANQYLAAKGQLHDAITHKEQVPIVDPLTGTKLGQQTMPISNYAQYGFSTADTANALGVFAATGDVSYAGMSKEQIAQVADAVVKTSYRGQLMGMSNTDSVRMPMILGAQAGYSLADQGRDPKFIEDSMTMLLTAANRSPLEPSDYADAAKFVAPVISPLLSGGTGNSRDQAMNREAQVLGLITSASSSGMDAGSIGRAIRMMADTYYDMNPQQSMAYGGLTGQVDKNFNLYDITGSETQINAPSAQDVFRGDLSIGTSTKFTTKPSDMNKWSNNLVWDEKNKKWNTNLPTTDSNVWRGVIAKEQMESSFAIGSMDNKIAASNLGMSGPGAAYSYGGMKGQFALQAQTINAQIQTLNVTEKAIAIQTPLQQAAMAAQMNYSNVAYGAGLRHDEFMASGEMVGMRRQLHEAERTETFAGIGRQERSVAIGRWYEDALYGKPGSDQSFNAYLDAQSNNLTADRGAQLANRAGQMGIAPPVVGLANQQFFRNIQHQQEMLSYGQSSLSGAEVYEEQMDYIKDQAKFYEETRKLEAEKRKEERAIQDEQMAAMKQLAIVAQQLKDAMFTENENQIQDALNVRYAEGEALAANNALTQSEIDLMAEKAAAQLQSIAAQKQQLEFELAMLPMQEERAKLELEHAEKMLRLTNALEQSELLGYFKQGPATNKPGFDSTGREPFIEMIKNIAHSWADAENPEEQNRVAAIWASTLQQWPGFASLMEGVASGKYDQDTSDFLNAAANSDGDAVIQAGQVDPAATNDLYWKAIKDDSQAFAGALNRAAMAAIAYVDKISGVLAKPINEKFLTDPRVGLAGSDTARGGMDTLTGLMGLGGIFFGAGRDLMGWGKGQSLSGGGGTGTLGRGRALGRGLLGRGVGAGVGAAGGYLAGKLIDDTGVDNFVGDLFGQDWELNDDVAKYGGAGIGALFGSGAGGGLLRAGLQGGKGLLNRLPGVNMGIVNKGMIGGKLLKGGAMAIGGNLAGRGIDAGFDHFGVNTGGLFKNVGTYAGMGAAFGPWGALAGAGVGLGITAFQNREAIGKFVGDHTPEQVKELAKKGWEELKRFWNWLSDLSWDDIKDAAKALPDKIKQAFSAIGDTLTDPTKLADAIKGFYGLIFKPFDMVIDLIPGGEKLTEGISKVFSIYVDAWATVASFVFETFGGIYSYLSENWNDPIQILKDAWGLITGTWGAIKSYVSEVWSNPTKLLSDLWGLVKGAFSLADGWLDEHGISISGAISLVWSALDGVFAAGIEYLDEQKEILKGQFATMFDAIVKAIDYMIPDWIWDGAKGWKNEGADAPPLPDGATAGMGNGNGTGSVSAPQAGTGEIDQETVNWLLGQIRDGLLAQGEPMHVGGDVRFPGDEYWKDIAVKLDDADMAELLRVFNSLNGDGSFDAGDAQKLAELAVMLADSPSGTSADPVYTKTIGILANGEEVTTLPKVGDGGNQDTGARSVVERIRATLQMAAQMFQKGLTPSVAQHPVNVLRERIQQIAQIFAKGTQDGAGAGTLVQRIRGRFDFLRGIVDEGMADGAGAGGMINIIRNRIGTIREWVGTGLDPSNGDWLTGMVGHIRKTIANIGTIFGNLLGGVLGTRNALGTAGHSGGPALVGEAGAELMRLPNGDLRVIDHPAYFSDLPAGTVIYKNNDLLQMRENAAQSRSVSAYEHGTAGGHWRYRHPQHENPGDAVREGWSAIKANSEASDRMDWASIMSRRGSSIRITPELDYRMSVNGNQGREVNISLTIHATGGADEAIIRKAAAVAIAEIKRQIEEI